MKVSKFKKTSQGFTLIELLLSLTLTSFMLIMTSVFLSTLLESRIKNQTIAEVEQQGAYVMQMITQATRNASRINTPLIGATDPTLSISTYTSSLNPTVFDLLVGVIRIKEGVAVPIELTNSNVIVSALTFYNLSRAGTPGSIRTSFILTHKNNTGRNEYNFSKTFVNGATLRQP